ncbi:hypothetical protein [Floridanema aerugineum]|uniref:Uncharacterized protein n=1 Tax=Floridaenema aerugineum BLCC-F46 TaxID=3153654 RepID=A0ABV4X5Y3_9CYAN
MITNQFFELALLYSNPKLVLQETTQSLESLLPKKGQQSFHTLTSFGIALDINNILGGKKCPHNLQAMAQLAK